MSTKKVRTTRRRPAIRTAYRPLEVMTPAHPRWREFCAYLAGPDFCNVRLVSKKLRWHCDAGDGTKPFCRTILKAMGSFDIDTTFHFFETHGGHCDCEVLFNVDDEDLAKLARLQGLAN